MYCPTCRQERGGGFAPGVACGAGLPSPPPAESATPLEHPQFLLPHISRRSPGGGASSPPRYPRHPSPPMGRALTPVLDAPEGKAPEVRSWQVPTADVVGAEPANAQTNAADTAAAQANATHTESPHSATAHAAAATS